MWFAESLDDFYGLSSACHFAADGLGLLGSQPIVVVCDDVGRTLSLRDPWCAQLGQTRVRLGPVSGPC